MKKDDARLGEIADRTGYQLRRVDMLSMEALQDEMSKLGVPPGRATALAYIGLHPGCDQTELGNVLGINRASTMAAVNNLVSIGVVERRPGRDRRSNALHLTEAGHRLRAEVVQLTADHEEWFFASLTSEERAEFRRLLLKIRQAHGSAEPRLPASKRALLRRVK
jgi:DNA-binding MarR family transcriptional regulator